MTPPMNAIAHMECIPVFRIFYKPNRALTTRHCPLHQTHELDFIASLCFYCTQHVLYVFHPSCRH